MLKQTVNLYKKIVEKKINIGKTTLKGSIKIYFLIQNDQKHDKINKIDKKNYFK